MEKKVVSRMMLVLLLVGTVPLTFNIEPVKGKPAEIMVSDKRLEIQTAPERVPGVHVGDWAKYDLAVNYSTNDPHPPVSPPPPGIREIEYYKVEVLSLTGTNITFQTIIHFKNGTETTMVTWTDISGASPMGPPFFIAANLSAGDPVYLNRPSPTINATLMRSYAGVQREVNYIHMESDISPAPYRAHSLAEIYWDRATGILDELIKTMQYQKIPEHYLTHVFVRLLMKETNIWGAKYISAEVNVTPESLNLRSKGKWITACIELPEGYSVRDIDVSSIRLNGSISAELKSRGIGDHDGEGVTDLMVKFSRASVTAYILSKLKTSNGFATVTLTLTGKLNDGTPFQGSDTIKIIYMMPKCGRFIQWV